VDVEIGPFGIEAGRRGVGENLLDRLRKLFGPARWDQDSRLAIADQLGNRRDPGAHDRDLHRHCFYEDVRDPVAIPVRQQDRREHKEIGPRILIADLMWGEAAEKAHVTVQIQPSAEGFEGRPLRSVTDQDQLKTEVSLPQQGDRAKKIIEPLLRNVTSYREDSWWIVFAALCLDHGRERLEIGAVVPDVDGGRASEGE
jgi:hypothetical protein